MTYDMPPPSPYPHVLHHHQHPQVPLLTNGQMVDDDDDIPPEHHALVPSSSSYMGGNGNRSGGKRIHPLPFTDPTNLPVHPRSMDPSKDLVAYGYGSVAWKERMESWKQQKQDKLQMTSRNDNSGKDWDNDADTDSPDLPFCLDVMDDSLFASLEEHS